MLSIKHRIASLFLSATMLVTGAAGLAVPASADGSSTANTAIIEGGMGAIIAFVPGGPAISGFLRPIVNKLFNSSSDPTADAIAKMNTEIKARLDEIEKEIKETGKDLMEAYKNELYINTIGKDLDDLYAEITKKAINIHTNNTSTKLTENERLVENAYLIGNNKAWGEPNNIVFSIDKLANILSGQTFSKLDNRDFYKVVYDANAANCMFSGEAYDDSEKYIDRVMFVYFYGCGLISECLADSRAVSKLTPDEVKALSPLVYQHYLECGVAEPGDIDDQCDLIAKNVYDTENPNSVISHYSMYKYEKVNLRNLFINKGHGTPVPISSSIDSQLFSFKEYSTTRRQRTSSGVDKYIESIKKNMADYANSNAIPPSSMHDLADYYFSRYKDGSFYSFLKDMCGIDCGNLASDALFPIAHSGSSSAVWESRDHRNGDYDHWYIYFDGINDKQTAKAFVYELNAKEQFYSSPCKTKNHPSTMALLKKGTAADIPKTAKEIMDYETTEKNNITVKVKQGHISLFLVPDLLTNYSSYDLSSLIIVTITNMYNFEVSLPYSWELKETTGAKLEEFLYRQRLNIYSEGTYHIRAKAIDALGRTNYSDWVEINASKQLLLFDLSGAFTGTVGAGPVLIEPAGGDDDEEGVDLSNAIMITDLTESGEYYIWEALETDGITIDEIGLVSFTKPGTFHVRVVSESGKYASDWQEITAVLPYRPTPVIPTVTTSTAATTTTTENTAASADVSSNTDTSSPKMWAQQGDDGTVTVGWEKINGASKYILYYEKDGKNVKVTETAKSKVLIKNTKNNFTYNFRLKYVISGQTYDAPSAYKAAVGVYYKPVVKLTEKDGKITASWKKVEGAEKYRVYRIVNGRMKLVKETEKNAVRFVSTKSGETYTVSVSALVNGRWTTLTKSDRASITAK